MVFGYMQDRIFNYNCLSGSEVVLPYDPLGILINLLNKSKDL